MLTLLMRQSFPFSILIYIRAFHSQDTVQSDALTVLTLRCGVSLLSIALFILANMSEQGVLVKRQV